jgi:hypothetical protein
LRLDANGLLISACICFVPTFIAIYCLGTMPLIQDLNVDQLKLPLGFIKIPELVLAIIAFSARSGWRFAVKYTVSLVLEECTYYFVDLVRRRSGIQQDF